MAITPKEAKNLATTINDQEERIVDSLERSIDQALKLGYKPGKTFEYAIIEQPCPGQIRPHMIEKELKERYEKVGWKVKFDKGKGYQNQGKYICLDE